MAAVDDSDSPHPFQELLDAARLITAVCVASRDVRLSSEEREGIAHRGVVLALERVAREAGLPKTTEPRDLVDADRLLAVAVASGFRKSKTRVQPDGRVTGHLRPPAGASAFEFVSYEVANLLLAVIREWGSANRSFSAPSQ